MHMIAGRHGGAAGARHAAAPDAVRGDKPDILHHAVSSGAVLPPVRCMPVCAVCSRSQHGRTLGSGRRFRTHKLSAWCCRTMLEHYDPAQLLVVASSHEVHTRFVLQWSCMTCVVPPPTRSRKGMADIYTSAVLAQRMPPHPSRLKMEGWTCIPTHAGRDHGSEPHDGAVHTGPTAAWLF